MRLQTTKCRGAKELVRPTWYPQKPKLVALLRGGLGNQLFIYAAARALALECDAELVFDTRTFLLDKVYRRSLALDAFACDLRLRRCPSYVYAKIWSQIRRRMPSLLEACGWQIEKPPFTYKKIDTDWSGIKVLDGLWQSERYFYRHRHQIVNDLKLKDESWIGDDGTAVEIMSEKHATFLHVRSYTDIPGKQDYSAALPARYYANALSRLKALCPGARKIFLFSDDLKWAVERIVPLASANDFEIVPVGLHEKSSQLRDFSLMRLCKHGIVANSSFSWWAGWLGEREWLRNGEIPIRIHADIRGMNDNYWPARWERVGCV